MIADALVSSLVFPLMESSYLLGHVASLTASKAWNRLHDKFIEERHPGLSLDEVKELRQWAWGAFEDVTPMPRDAVRRMAECLTKPHRGKIVLSENAFDDKPSLSGRTDVFPIDIQKAWTFASRYVDPEILCAWHWSKKENDPEKQDGCWPEVGVSSAQFEHFLKEDIGDYHVHWGAVRTFDSFLPIISTLDRPMDSLGGWGDDNNWIYVDWFGTGRVYPDLLVMVHGTICCWLRQYILNLESGKKGRKVKWAQPLLDITSAERYWRKLVEILAQPPVKHDSQAIISKLEPVLQIDGGKHDKGLEYADHIFLYKSFRAYEQTLPDEGTSKKDAFVFLFDKMLWLRSGLYRLVTQQPGAPGLKSFKRWHSQIKNLNVDSVTRDESTLYDKINVLTQGNPKGIKTLEFRIVIPGTSARSKKKREEDWYKEYLRLYFEWKNLKGQEDVTDQKAIEVCFSASLIKEEREDVFKNTKVRHSAILNEYRQQIDDFISFLEQRDNSQILHLIKGLDVCNLEKALPNWVPLLIYQHFNNEAEEKIYIGDSLSHKHTFHAGEDFYSPSDGLRAVYECIEMGGIDQGDRIGHGIVLGLNIEYWAASRKICIVPAGVLLDDLVWEWCCVITDCFKGDVKKIEHEIELVQKEINSGYTRDKSLGISGLVTPNILWDAYVLRFGYGELKSGLGNKKLKLITGNEWFTWQKCNKLKSVDGDEYKVFWEYLCDPARWRAEQIPILVKIDKNRIKRFKNLQEYVTGFAKDKVGIEMCPASNVLVGGLGEYSRHPIFQLCPIGREDSGISVSINSDDPVTFNTNVRKEYQNLYLAAKELVAQEIINVTDQKIKNWLKRINKMGQEYSFSNRDEKANKKLEELYSKFYPRVIKRKERRT